MKKRKATRQIKLGDVKVGGGAPIAVQSMTKTITGNTAKTIKQILTLRDVGCDIVRVAIRDRGEAESLRKITKEVSIPVVADIHFDYRLAVVAARSGAAGIRINPGNIGGKKRVEEVVRACKGEGIPIRIGINSGSLEKRLKRRYGGANAKALVESALDKVKQIEDLDFFDMKVSLKASEVLTTIEAYRLFSQESDYPLHIGITAAGTLFSGAIKSAVGLGILLHEGIGDTLRVSLSGDPVNEVLTAKKILKSLELMEGGLEVASCPTCGRTEIDVVKIAGQVEKRLGHITPSLKLAVMGCVVNGPGEAEGADMAFVGVKKGMAVVYKKGTKIKTLPLKEGIDFFINEAVLMAGK